MADRALRSLKPHAAARVLVTQDQEVAQALDVPSRPDRIPGLGPLGGLLTALEWAEELKYERVFLLACDLPLVSSDLVGQILAHWPPGSPASIPTSRGPLGFEPLCAAYSVAALPSAMAVIHSDLRSMERFLEEMGVSPVELSGWTEEELALAFTNVNTRDDAQRADGLLRQAERGNRGAV
jgi:molybdopterin-guanine dinucleotide biosynthesis protein A